MTGGDSEVGTEEAPRFVIETNKVLNSQDNY